MSQDKHYCQQCYDSLKADEYRFDGKATETKIAVLTTEPMQSPMKEQETKMSTLNSTSPEVDNFRPRGRPKTYEKRALPDGIIKQLHDDGMGAKAIATNLKTEEGIDVSYKTIQRVLSGERTALP